jgi:hypothetical protein
MTGISLREAGPAPLAGDIEALRANSVAVFGSILPKLYPKYHAVTMKDFFATASAGAFVLLL